MFAREASAEYRESTFANFDEMVESCCTGGLPATVAFPPVDTLAPVPVLVPASADPVVHEFHTVSVGLSTTGLLSVPSTWALPCRLTLFLVMSDAEMPKLIGWILTN